MGNFSAARADTLALVGLPPDAPHVPQRLPVDVQHIWAHLDMAERDLRRRCTRCAHGACENPKPSLGALGHGGARPAAALHAVRPRRVYKPKSECIWTWRARPAAAVHAVRPQRMLRT